MMTSAWKPMVTAVTCTALLGMVAGMRIPVEMRPAPEPWWRGLVEKGYVPGDDARPLYEAGPEDLFVPRDPMEQRVSYDAMEYMDRRAFGPERVAAVYSDAPPARMQQAAMVAAPDAGRSQADAAPTLEEPAVRVTSGTAQLPLDDAASDADAVEASQDLAIAPEI